MRPVRKLCQKAFQGVGANWVGKPRPDKGLESAARHAQRHPLREAGEVIAKILDTVTGLDELPVGQLLRLGDLFRRKAGDGVEPRPLLFRPRRLVNLGGFFRRAPRFGGRGLGFGLVVRVLHFRECVFERLDQPLRVGLEPLLRQPDRISPRERLERLRQRLGARHFGLLHQNRNDPLAELERRFDLDADKILWIFEPGPPRFIGHGQPVGADQCKHHIAGADLLLDHPHKVLASPDAALDIHEQAF
jgi:hypothetical protein